MRTADLITAFALVAIGVLVVVDALRLGIGWGSDGPQSGFFPFWLAVTMIAACTGIIGRALRSGSSKPFVTWAALRPVLTVLIPAASAVLLMQFVGLYVASACYLAFYMRWVGRHSWPAVIAIGLAFPLVSFLIFERWFLVPMPKGPVEAWLGL
jgi:putative tricarboxylic transport membrane protein